MNRFMRTTVFIACSLTLLVSKNGYSVPPYITFRSQAVNSPRHLVGVTQYINKADKEFPYGLLSATFEYGKTFRDNTLRDTLFAGALQQCDKLVISGSQVPNRGAKDWLADYFYLPPDFQSTVALHPSMSYFLVDFNWYLGLDQWHPGLYFALYAPFVHMRSHIEVEEVIPTKSSTDFPAGYFGPQPVPVGSLPTGFKSYANGDPIQDIQQTLAGTSVSIALQSLNNARISSKERKRTRLADLRALFGWNMLNDEDDKWRVGMYGSLSAPTGIRPKGKYLLEPIVGNGHQWELGFGVNGAYTMWDNPHRDYKLTLSFDALFSHLFGTHQKRTFDIVDKPFSRYMLALKFADQIDNNLKGGGTTPNAQFDNEMAPVANISTLCVRASAAAQADIVAMLTLNTPHWSFDCGYNFWIRSAERLSLEENIGSAVNMQKWGLKGDADVFGFIPTGGGATLPVNTPVALSATQHDATINTGLNLTNTLNANIDSPALATGDTNNVPLQNQTNSIGNQINTSVNPQFLTLSSFETCKITTLGLSNALFGHVQYHCLSHNEWEPSIGLGFKVEFAKTDTDEYEHPACAASMWNIWVKAAVAFD